MKPVFRDLEQKIKREDDVDSQFRIHLLKTPGVHTGYLYNMRESQILHKNEEPQSALLCYFAKQNLSVFKIKIPFNPYVLVSAPEQNMPQIQSLIEKSGINVEHVTKEDASAANHVAGARTHFLKLVFRNRQKLQEFLKNFQNDKGQRVYETDVPHVLRPNESLGDLKQLPAHMSKLAEHDVADGLRTAIDMDVRCATWYNVHIEPGNVRLERNQVLKLPPKLKVLAFDIETTKQPMCFPNALLGDQVMCLSYVMDGRGVLLVNRQVFSADIADFEYSPSPQMETKFKIFNLMNERDLILFFMDQIRKVAPQIISSYNGDGFDFKFIHQRCIQLGIDFDALGFDTQQTKSRFGSDQSEYTHQNIVHIDCLRWVIRDSYLPQGSQGLKAVTKKKLKYNPVELSPELMTTYAKIKPNELAQYSVSDSVATYYLYKKFIESFVLALCTIIPLNPDSVLRKGTGTLCESLLMVEATAVHMAYPDKIGSQGLVIEKVDKNDPLNTELEQKLVTNYSGCNSIQHDLEEIQLKQVGITELEPPIDKSMHKLLISQTYAGGRVEAINSGVYRADIQYQFGTHKDSKSGYQILIDQLDQDLEYFIYSQNQEKIDMIAVEEDKTWFYPVKKTKQFISSNIKNFGDVKNALTIQLQQIGERSQNSFMDRPVIYHLDVSAMYPNIILTNRLQPHAIVTDKQCSCCDYNFVESKCKRRMTWMWRGIYYPCTIQEYNMVYQQLSQEKQWTNLSDKDRELRVKHHLELFCQKTYHSKQKSTELLRESTTCQRENPFFVDTVKNFRNRRYIYKKEQKVAQEKAGEFEQLLKQPNLSSTERQTLQQQVETQKGLVVLNESLQLAHKAILNSFYGYAMRAGSRWFSMEMAACVTFVGAQIIKRARWLVERVGIPLELDTDGIWCMLPAAFPDKLKFELQNNKALSFQYPAVMLNAMTAQYFTNEQHQEREGQTHQFRAKPECSIEFEIDGPYHAMFLSAAKEEGKKIKKRYCVFDFDKNIAELKGFELKRRGELQLIKSFQERIFIRFLDGTSLDDCYAAAGKIATYYLDLLRAKGVGYDEKLVMQLLSESSTMKLSLKDTPANKKGAAITTTKRLAKFLDEIFATVSALTTTYVIMKQPQDLAVSERAVPVQIFDAPESVRANHLRQWTGQQSVDLRDLLDWEYYETRFVNCLMRIVVVPAGLQGIKESPVVGVDYPDWLKKSSSRQLSIDEMMALVERHDAGDDDASSDEESEQEKAGDDENVQYASVTVEAVMQKHGLTVEQSSLQLLNKAAKNKVTRSESAPLWLLAQTQKWKFLIQSEQLNKTLVQRSRDQIYASSDQRQIVSNDIVSQLRGRFTMHRYTVLAAVEQRPGVVELTLANPQRHELFVAAMAVPRELIVQLSDPGQTDFLQHEDAAVTQCELCFLPFQTRRANLLRVELPERTFIRDQSYIQQKLANRLVLGAFHQQVTAVERFVIYKGCCLELSQRGRAEMEQRSVSFANVSGYEATQVMFGSDAPTLPVQFAISYKLAEGELCLVLNDSEFIVLTNADLGADDVRPLFDQFVEGASAIRQQSDTTEKQVLSRLLHMFRAAAFQFVSKTGQTNILESYYKKDVEHALVFYLGDRRPISPNKCFIRLQPFFDEQSSLAQILLEMAGAASQLELLARISKVPPKLLAENQAIYGTQQPSRLCCVDFAYARQLVRSKQVLWLSKQGEQPVGRHISQIVSVCEAHPYETQAFCRGVAAQFDVRYAYAHVLQDADSRDLRAAAAVVNQAQCSSSVLEYFEEYFRCQSALLHSRAIQAKMEDLAQKFIDSVVDTAIACALVPIHISTSTWLVQTDKLSERLAASQLQAFVAKFKHQIVLLQPKFFAQLLLYQNRYNYIGVTPENNIVNKCESEALRQMVQWRDLAGALVGFLLYQKQYAEKMQPSPVSLLQLGGSSVAGEYVDCLKARLWNTARQNVAYPLSLALTIPTITDLRALKLGGWEAYSQFLRMLELDTAVEDQALEMQRTAQRLFGAPEEQQPIRGITVRTMCARCGYYTEINFAHNPKLTCSSCISPLRNEDVQESAVQRLREVFDEGLGDAAVVLEWAVGGFEAAGFDVAARQAKVLGKMLE